VLDLRSPSKRSRASGAVGPHGILNCVRALGYRCRCEPRDSSGHARPQHVLGTFDRLAMYWNVLDLNTERLIRILSLLTEPHTVRVSIQCGAGRDRTAALRFSLPETSPCRRN
jgi:hypothetical protein